MHWFDISVGFVMLLGGIRSYFRGLTREVMSAIGLIVVFVFAVWGYGYVPRYLEPVLTSPWWRQIAVYIVLIIAAVGAYRLWVKAAERLLYAELSVPDRVLGGLFGAIKVGIVMAAGFVLLIQATPDRVATVMPGSTLAPPLLQTAKVITSLLPRDVQHAFRRAYRRVRQQSGKRVAHPSQASEPPAGISKNDDRALRRLIKEYSKEP